ncbi:mobilization protein [Phocaeicola vulgatus]|uniref:mobilization protein n=1 Tax=Phocaeicola vulgatus TaxID=821 RepID=UPI0035690929
MAQKTSINIKPCNTGSSEEHNRRKAEYLARINKEKLYIRTDLMASNEAWVAPESGNTSLADRYNQIAQMVKEKTGRAMQTKDRERVNKKTGKVSIVRGSTPLKEGVVVINESTSMEQLHRFCEVCKERWGITPLQVFIHRDEGHYSNPQDPATWKPNLHAHIVWDWMNHDTGKSCKLDEKDMSEMQTLLAECLEMERGISKELTGKKHLERTDFIIAKQKQEAEQAKAEKEAALSAKEEAEAERNSLEVENKAKAERSAALDSEIADKQKKRDDIRKNTVDGILDSVGSLVGIGKTATLEKEYKQLAQDFERLKKAFKPTVIKEVEKQTRVLASEKQKAEAERENALEKCRFLVTERDRAISQFNSQNENMQLRINNAVRLANEEKDKTINRLQGELNLRKQVLAILADMLYAASEVFKRAIDAIIHYGTDKYKSIFGNDEATDIKSVMQNYGETKEQQQAIGTWLCDYADSRQSFDGIKNRQTYKEVADVANGAYDWKIERGQKDGIKM